MKAYYTLKRKWRETEVNEKMILKRKKRIMTRKIKIANTAILIIKQKNKNEQSK